MNPRYTFDSFTSGKSNRLAYAMARAITKSPGKKYNPGWVFGSVGLGRTHLLQAIGNAILRQRSKARVLYVTADQFTKECERAVRAKKLPTFRARYHSVDCLLIDDIQFLIARDRAEQEFLHILKELLGARRQIVIAADRSPQEMAPFLPGLIALMESGTVTEISRPDLETRLAIVRKKLREEKFFVPRDVIRFVSSSIKTNVRCLEGALIRLKAYHSMTGTRLTVGDARDILKDAIAADAEA